MAESKARGRDDNSSSRRIRARSRGKLSYLNSCAIWQAINARDKSQDTRKSQKNLKLERLRHTHQCFLQPGVPEISSHQLVTLLERFESQDERSHCALMATFLVKNEPETRSPDIWIEAGVEPTVAELCSEIMLAFDMREQLVQHRELAAELDRNATDHLQEAKRMMRLDRKIQNGEAIFQNLSKAMEAKDPVVKQATFAHEKLEAAIQLCSQLNKFCTHLDSIFGSVLNTCPEEGKDVLRAGAQHPANYIREHLDECQKVVAELDVLAEHTIQVYNDAEHHSSTFIPPLTDSQRQKKMMERKAYATQAYVERMKKKSMKDNSWKAEKK